MRTAGKRPKSLPARRIRPRDSRFVPTLTDRPQPAPWIAPSASLAARKHAACGDFQEPLSASPDRCLCKKIFFIRSAGCPVAARFPLSSFPQGRHTRHLLSPVFPAMPVPAAAAPAYRPAPCFPSSYKGMDLPAPHPGNRLPPHKKLLPMAGLSQRLLRSSSTPVPPQHPNRRPCRTREPYAPREPAAVVDSKGETPGAPRPGAPAARTLPSH